MDGWRGVYRGGGDERIQSDDYEAVNELRFGAVSERFEVIEEGGREADT